uniref:Peptidase M14 domain-containing protein n=1 Tax=Arion vulgaris TaxID=1028688 RepID=A0A0B6YQ37_9EUPU
MNSDIKYLQVIFLGTVIVLFFQENVGLDQVGAQKEIYEPDYSVYHNLTSIVSDLTEIINKYRNFIIASHEFKSKNGHTQFLIRLSNFTRERTKVKILLAYGEHAREFFPIESMFYFLKNLTKGLDKPFEGRPSNTFSSWVVNNFDLYIIAITNPDGRSYIERTKNYCWRGTGAGIDLNRNFDWNYGGIGSSKYRGDEEYRGPKAFSEPETLVFRRLAASVSFDAFLSFHSGIRHIYIPFSDTKSKQQHRLPKNNDDMFKLAKQMSNSSTLRPFKYGLVYQMIDYTADGTSIDYMAGVAEVPFSLAIEMWEHEHHTGRSCFDEFNPKSEHLQDEVALVHPLYVELLSYLFTWKKKKLMTVSSLLRVKKDDRTLNQSDHHDVLYSSHPSSEVMYSASFESLVVCIFFSLVAVVCVVLGARQICQLMRKKRIISLKSLSSTFSLYKSL